MKNKKITYLLIVAVAAIWGMIIYRAVASLDGDDDVVVVTPPVKKEVFDDYTVKTDTAKLPLNYRDPFGMVKFKDTVTVKPSATRSGTERIARPAVNWGVIKYSGYIRDPDSKKLITILTINERKAMLAEGESAEGIRLIKNLGDSVKVACKGETKYISVH